MKMRRDLRLRRHVALAKRKSYCPTTARIASAIATAAARGPQLSALQSSAFRSGFRAEAERGDGRNCLFFLSATPPCISTCLGRATPTNRTPSPEMKLVAWSDRPNKRPTSSQPRRSPVRADKGMTFLSIGLRLPHLCKAIEYSKAEIVCRYQAHQSRFGQMKRRGQGDKVEQKQKSNYRTHFPLPTVSALGLVECEAGSRSDCSSNRVPRSYP